MAEQINNQTSRCRITLWPDFLAAMRSAPLWSFLAWHDIRIKYRRSKIGPLWITLSMAVFCISLGVVYGGIFHSEMSEYLPFLCAGYIEWFFLSTVISEAPAIYVNNGAYMRDMYINPLTILFREIARNALILGHNALIIVGVYIYFRINPGLHALLALPGFALVMLSVINICLILSIVGARYRDVSQMTQSVVLIFFFISPISWFPRLVAPDSWLVKYNPVAVYLDLVRTPLLGGFPAPMSWIYGAALFAITLVLATLLYQLKGRRITFWV